MELAYQSTLLTCCLHCGESLTFLQRKTGYCCLGCQAVHQLLSSEGLTRFYELKPTKLLPLIDYFSRQTDFSWVDRLTNLSQGTVLLDIEGLQCTACVWLIEEYVKRSQNARAYVDLTLGQIQIDFDPVKTDLKKLLQGLAQFGYRSMEHKENRDRDTDHSLLIRLGVCGAIAMNTMFFSFSLYLGLSPKDGPLFNLFLSLNFVFTFISVLVGGSYFFGRALQGLRVGILHFDLPIAIGILASFMGSVVSVLHGNLKGAYFDTVCVFTALMLAGRYAQNRFLAKNRSRLLKDDTIRNLMVTVVQSSFLEKRFSEVVAGDILLIQPGQLFPVESCLIDDDLSVECSLSSMTGEAEPRIFKASDVIPSGARLLSTCAVKVTAQSAFNDTLLSRLLPERGASDALPVVWKWVNRLYVIIVLCLGTLGYLLWHLIDPQKALVVFVSVMVVTCPCGIGISIPMARSLANRRLMKRGVFAQSGDLLDRWLAIKKIFCDKTGTLTLANLTLTNPDILQSIPLYDRQVLFQAVAQSRHPASVALYQMLVGEQFSLLDLQVTEKAGEGLSITDQKNNYYLGRPVSQKNQQDQKNNSSYKTLFKKEGGGEWLFTFAEQSLLDAHESVERLKKLGKEIYLISGDHQERVAKMGAELGVPADHIFSECHPTDKEKILTLFNNNDTLMIGDGLNDALAFDKAHVSGGPIWERQGVGDKSDFTFLAGSLSWLPDTFLLANQLKKVVNFNLWFALFYNVLVVSLALSGKMSPLLCAVLMPVSSIVLVSLTAYRMKESS